MSKDWRRTLIVLEFAGLQNFSLKDIGTDNPSGKKSWFRTFYSLLLITFFSIFGVWFGASGFFIIVDGSSGRNALRFLASNITSFGMFVVIVISLIQSLKSTEKEKKFFANRDDIINLIQKEFVIQQ
jgi:hypothetical protein